MAQRFDVCNGDADGRDLQARVHPFGQGVRRTLAISARYTATHIAGAKYISFEKGGRVNLVCITQGPHTLEKTDDEVNKPDRGVDCSGGYQRAIEFADCAPRIPGKTAVRNTLHQLPHVADALAQ